MKKIFLTVIVSFSFVCSLFAQSVGRVQDAEGCPLEFATVALFDQDSTIVDAATTDSLGVFRLEKDCKGIQYRLSVSLLGYKTYEENIQISDDLGTILLAEDAEALDAAKITEKKQLIVQKIDKIIFNVSEAVSAQGKTGDEILKKAPGISIDKDGNVKLNGQSVAVWIDNRPSQLSGQDLIAILKTMDASNIDNIEIMAHPSSKYDAQGAGGIINIKLKQNKITGLNGSVGMTHEGWVYSKEYVHSTRGNLNLNYRGKSSNSTFTYSGKGERDMYKMENESILTDPVNPEITLQNVQSTNTIREKSQHHSLRIVHDQYFGEKDILGFIVSGTWSENKNLSVPTDTWTQITTPQGTTFQRSTIIDNSTRPNIQGDVNYTHTFDKEKNSEITVDLMYGFYRSDKLNDMNSPYYDEDGNELPAEVAVPQIFRSKGLQDINIYSAKVDFTHNFAEKYAFEAGAKYGLTRTMNHTLREDKDYTNPSDPQWKPNPGFSSDYIYTEHIAALYANIASSFFQGKLTAKIGLRGEYTNSLGQWLSEDKTTRRGYFNLFPTVFVGYNPHKDHRLSLSYSRRIDRPSYYNLNPQYTYYDAVTAVVGNPDLNPAFNHQIFCSYGFSTWLNITLMYMYTKDSIMQEPFNNPDLGVTGLCWKNIGVNNFAGVSLAVSEAPITKWWTFNANVFTGYIHSKGGNYVQQSFMCFAYGDFTFRLPKDWRIETGVWGSSGFKVNKAQVSPSVSIWAGIEKDILKGNGTISLNIDDILDSNDKFDSRDGNIAFKIHYYWNSRRAVLSFRYRFGRAHATKYRSVGNLEESSRVGGGSATGNMGGQMKQK